MEVQQIRLDNELNFCLEFKKKIIQDFFPTFQILFSISNTFVTIYFGHDYALNKTEVATIVKQLVDFFNKHSLPEIEWECNFIYKTEICIAEEYNLQTKFAFVHLERKYRGWRDHRNINSSFLQFVIKK